MKILSLPLFVLCTSTSAALPLQGGAGSAVLLDQRTIIDNLPIGPGPEDTFGSPGYALNSGDGVSSGWVDAAILAYDFGTVTSVSSATLTIDVDNLYADAGMAPVIELYSYADDGAIQLGDLHAGSGTVHDSFQYLTQQVRSIDVTVAVNEALKAGPFVGLRSENSRSPFELPGSLLEGVHFVPVSLDYVAGPNIAVSGACPGTLDLEVGGATPGGPVLYLFSFHEGAASLPLGPCAGATLGLGAPVRLLGSHPAGAAGTSSFHVRSLPTVCGGYVQAFDLGSCAGTNVVRI